jgi:hypothetical protein
MKTKEASSKKMVKVPEAALLSLVAESLKGKDLFPKKTKAARRFLAKVKFPNS